MFLVQERSLILQTEGIEEVNSEIIINLFYGSLEKFKTSIEGLRITNFKEKKYLITFAEIPKSMMTSVRDPVHCICQDGLTRKNGIILRSFIPESPAEMITLFPVPFEMREQHLKTLEQKGWGEIKKIKFGTLRNFPSIKNGYVNVFVQNPNYNMIGGQVNILGHWVSVTTPYNRHLPMCRFCKTRGHEISECERLKRKMEAEQKQRQQKKRILITYSSDEEEEEKKKEIPLEEFIVVGKKRPRFSTKNRKKKKRAKKNVKPNESEPDSSTVEIGESEEILSDEEKHEEKKEKETKILPEEEHPQLSDSTESQNIEEKNKTENKKEKEKEEEEEDNESKRKESTSSSYY